MELTYFSKNIYMLPFFLSPDNNSRLSKIISEIKNLNPDIVALQEVWTNSAVDRIKRELGDYSFIGGGNFFNKGGLITGIRGKKITATRHSFTSITNSSWIENLGGKGYHILTLPKNLRFINTHLYAPTKSADLSITKKQFLFLCDLLRKKGGILAGDLNIEQFDFLKINKLFQYNFTNESTLSMKNKYANARLNYTPFDKKVDYVIGTGGIQVTEKILNDVETSDHFGLTGNIIYY